jgi:hypothetical protein
MAATDPMSGRGKHVHGWHNNPKHDATNGHNEALDQHEKGLNDGSEHSNDSDEGVEMKRTKQRKRNSRRSLLLSSDDDDNDEKNEAMRRKLEEREAARREYNETMAIIKAVKLEEMREVEQLAMKFVEQTFSANWTSYDSFSKSFSLPKIFKSNAMTVSYENVGSGGHCFGACLNISGDMNSIKPVMRDVCNGISPLTEYAFMNLRLYQTHEVSSTGTNMKLVRHFLAISKDTLMLCTLYTGGVTPCKLYILQRHPESFEFIQTAVEQKPFALEVERSAKLWTFLAYNKRDAAAMALHPRVGSASGLRILPTETLEHVLRDVAPFEQGTLSQVLQVIREKVYRQSGLTLGSRFRTQCFPVQCKCKLCGKRILI